MNEMSELHGGQSEAFDAAGSVRRAEQELLGVEKAEAAGREGATSEAQLEERPDRPRLSVFEQFEELEGQFWAAARVVRDEEQLLGHYETSDEMDHGVTAGRSQQVEGYLAVLRHERQSEHPLIALRAEYLVACLYGRIDGGILDKALLGEASQKEFDDYVKRYGSQFFDDIGDFDDPEQLASTGQTFANVSSKVQLPPEIYQRAEGSHNRDTVTALQVARDGVAYLAGSNGNDLSDSKNIVAVARIGAESLSDRAPARVRPDKVLEYQSAVEGGQVERQRELLLYGPDYMQGGFRPNEIQVRKQSDDDRVTYWHQMAPSLGEADWRMVLDRAREHNQPSEDRPISADEYFREAPFHDFLSELGVEPSRALEVESQVRTSLGQVASELNEKLVPAQDVAFFDKSDQTDELWRNIFLEPGMKRVLNEQLGVDIGTMSLAAQRQLIGFLGNGSVGEFHRLEAVLDRQGDVEKIRTLESFLALEEGEEFGDSLLTIVEELPESESKRLMDGLTQVRDRAAELSHQYKDYDPEFAGQTERAYVRRTTQLLAVAEQLALGVQPSTELYNGTKVDVPALGEVFWGLDVIKDRLEVEVGRLAGGGGQIEREDGSTTTLRMPDGGLVQLRSYGATPNQQDLAHHFDNEARINSLVSMDGTRVEEGRDHISRVHALSVRFDREGIWRQESGAPLLDRQGNMINEPTGEYGWVSLDIGAIAGEPDDPNVRMGKLLAVGEAIYAKRRGQHPNLNHVREVFDPKFGRAEEFARLVEYQKRQLMRPASSEQRLAA